MEKQSKTKLSEPFKIGIIEQILSGKLTKEEARQQYGIKGKSAILYWIRNYEKFGHCNITLARQPKLSMGHKEKPNTTRQQQELEGHIKLLERRLEEESLLREMYSRMIDIAEKEYKIPIRKKPNTK